MDRGSKSRRGPSRFRTSLTGILECVSIIKGLVRDKTQIFHVCRK
jgi:hypothetical protein